MSGPIQRTAGLVVTLNPDLNALRPVLSAVAHQTIAGIVVDNGSKNVAQIRDQLPENFDILSNSSNMGIASALNRGVDALLRTGDFDWVLTLDQDTVLHPEYVRTLLEFVEESPIGNQIGVVTAVSAQDTRSTGEFASVPRVYTSGNLVRTDVARRVRYREEFFADQVDFDFSAAVLALGYHIFVYDFPLLGHAMGVRRERLGRALRYEPAWRYYYIVRNSTVLLHEGKYPLYPYLRQLLYWGVLLFLCDGAASALRTLLRGFADAAAGHLGPCEHSLPKQR